MAVGNRLGREEEHARRTKRPHLPRDPGTRPVPADLSAGWHAALSEAWAAYCAGAYAIGACIVDARGTVIARGRNRLNEPRAAHAGVITGHDLAHAEINALLNLPDVPRPDCYGWTVLTTVEPCPQCAGAVSMSGIRALEYAAPDPWAGCARLLTDDPYVRRKQIRVGRAPQGVQRLATLLALVSFMEEGHDSLDSVVLAAYQGVTPDDVQTARHLHAAGTLRALRNRQVPLEEVLEALAEGVPDRSPGPDRVGRACAWIERPDGQVLMVGVHGGRWTLPGGGIHPGETGAQAAIREAWEEAGAHAEWTGQPPMALHGHSGTPSECWPLRLAHLGSSPEGRPVRWVDPRQAPWADDVQLRQVLAQRSPRESPSRQPPGDPADPSGP